MPVLPPISDFVTTGQTKATFKGALTGLRAYLSGLLGDAGTQAAALTALGAPLNGTLTKSGAYTVVAADRGKLIDCTGAGGWTLAVDACATLGGGFACAVRNSTTGIITVNPNLSEQVDGVVSFDLGPGESCLLIVDSTATHLRTVGKSVSNGEYRSVKIFTASGTYTKPAGLKRAKATVVGAGGGGANDTGISSRHNTGGSAGGAAIKFIEAASLLASETVTVGLGGAGATGSTSAAGGAGGASSFGSHCSATGGAGGFALDSRPQVSEPQAGVGTGGDINLKGGGGTWADRLGAASVDTVSQWFFSGRGGDSPLFGAGGRRQYAPAHGESGVGYGAGGASGVSNSTSDYNGGNGAGGVVIIEEFF